MGAFLPWFRNHYDNYYKPYQEPYRYPEPLPTICRKYIEIRYKLIQYIYDAMYENTLCGKPICRPLFMDEIIPGKSKHGLRESFKKVKSLFHGNSGGSTPTTILLHIYPRSFTRMISFGILT